MIIKQQQQQRRRRQEEEQQQPKHLKEHILKIYLVYYKYNWYHAKPGLIAYFDDDILAMINMFAKTCKKFLEYDPLRCYYFRVY